jgi:hypothetical protein
MNPLAELRQISCASIPVHSLAGLAGIRELRDVSVMVVNDRAWLHWQSDDARIVRSLFPIAGARLYAEREGVWYQHGRHLPAFDVPRWTDARPLNQVLTPAPVQALPSPPFTARRIAVTLVPEDQPRPTTALHCHARELAHWADNIPSRRLQSLRAARRDGRILLLGSQLPAIRDSHRFWGKMLLVPLGYRPDPNLPDKTIRDSLGLADDEFLLLDREQAETIPRTAFRPLTRAQLKSLTSDL